MQATAVDTSTFEPAEALEIHGLDTLKVMADSGRMAIVDLLRLRAATVKELAGSLKVPPKSLYYHVNLLERHGLIRVVETRLVSGIVEKRYRATAYLFNFSEIDKASGAPPGQSALEAVSSLFEITRDEIRVALESGLIALDEAAPPTATLSLDWALCNLTAEARAELWERIDTLVSEFHVDDQPAPDEQPYRLLCALFPTYRRGQRPPAEAPTGEIS